MLWPKEHWHVAGFVCLCLPVVAAVLVDFGVISSRAAVAGCIAGAVYVVLTTWLDTRGAKTKPDRSA